MTKIQKPAHTNTYLRSYRRERDSINLSSNAYENVDRGKDGRKSAGEQKKRESKRDNENVMTKLNIRKCC